MVCWRLKMRPEEQNSRYSSREERHKVSAVDLAVRVEEALFERVEMVLKQQVSHSRLPSVIRTAEVSGLCRRGRFYRIAKGMAGLLARATRGTFWRSLMKETPLQLASRSIRASCWPKPISRASSPFGLSALRASGTRRR